MNAVFTEHAKHAIKEREIETEWVLATIKNPELRERDPNDDELERFYRSIPDRGNRVLRVVINTELPTLAHCQRIL